MSSKLFIQIIALMIIGAAIMSAAKAVMLSSKCAIKAQALCPMCAAKQAGK